MARVLFGKSAPRVVRGAAAGFCSSLRSFVSPCGRVGAEQESSAGEVVPQMPKKVVTSPGLTPVPCTSNTNR
eukprot:3558054-Prymnesium_polylepis.1